jgi:hypothetical protein
MKDYKNSIPAWSYARSRRVEPSSGMDRKAQMEPDNFAEQDDEQPQPEAQQGTGVYVDYSFPFYITASVEYNPDNAKEIEEARAKMEKIYQDLYSKYGDNLSHRPDKAIKSRRGSLGMEDVNL